MRTLTSLRLFVPVSLGLAIVLPSCSSDDGGVDTANFPNFSCADVEGTCVQVTADDAQGLQDATNALEDDMTIVLGAGTFVLDNQVTLRGANGITLRGQGKDVTVLDFGTQTAQANGVDSVGDRFTVSDFTIVDAVKDGIRIEDSSDIVIQRLKVTWTNENDSTNGAYGIYPVKVERVLMEDSEAYNTSDAGIYVGQCRHAIVRNNIAKQNVAGIEIENTQYADVYGNLAEDNTGGLVVFDLPGNPVIGRDIYVHDNMVINNNRMNFAPGGTVRQIPPGTGTFAMASRRVEIANNTYMNNDTIDIALLSGLAIESNASSWVLDRAELVGDIDGLTLPGDADTVSNYRTNEIYIHDNTHSGSGTNPPDTSAEQALGALIGGLYGDVPVDEILYDTYDESSYHPTDPAMNSNDNLICLENNTGATFVSINLPALQGPLDNMYRPDAPFEPFNCSGWGQAPVAPMMPSNAP